MSEEAGCEEAFGIFPCSSSLWGSIVLMAMYGYMLLRGANLLSDGSEELLEVLDPGLVGGLLLPVLGALPDALIIVFSGLGGTKEEAAEQVAVGVGALAGSTIMLLTIAWGGSVLLGRCDYDRKGVAIDKTLTRTYDLWNTGVTTDAATKLNAAVMIVTMLLYLTIQIPTMLGHGDSFDAALTGAVLCLSSLAAYCIYQVVYPELQRRKIARAHARRDRRLRAAGAIHEFTKPLGSLVDENGNLVEETMHALFRQLDSNNDGTLDKNELKGLLTGLTLVGGTGPGDMGTVMANEVEYWMGEFDKDSTGTISFAEFRNELSKWVRAHALAQKGLDDVASDVSFTLEDAAAVAMPINGPPDEEDEENSEEEEEKVLSPRQVALQATFKLVMGALICAIISDPVVDAVTSFSRASGIPSFFVAFTVAPLGSNASELVSSLKFASRKKSSNIALTFSQVYGAVTMNNTMCLGLFLLVVSFRGLTWTYTSEVATIMLCTLILGVIGITVTRLRTWWGYLALALYPASIVFVYFGDYVWMWDAQNLPPPPAGL